MQHVQLNKSKRRNIDRIFNLFEDVAKSAEEAFPKWHDILLPSAHASSSSFTNSYKPVKMSLPTALLAGVGGEPS